MKQTDILCDNPKIILNPLWPELLSKYHHVFLDGAHIFFEDRYVLYSKKAPNALVYSLKYVTKDNIDNYVVIDDSTGQTYPLYMFVPCGHCDNCKCSKVNAFVHRCKLETMLYDCKPLFLTLTYDELHKKECGVCLRDVQLFFKRLRINLQRSGYRGRSIRYVLVAEYGSRTARPHYHAILWNLGSTDICSFGQIRSLVEKSWSNGFVMLRFVEPSNDKAFYYTSKYLRKDCCVPEGCNKTFMVSSNRGGGIGAKFVDLLAREVHRTLNVNPKFFNRFSGKTENLQLNRYVLSRLWPTMSRSLSSKVRTAMRRFVLNYRALQYLENSGLTSCCSSYFDDSFIKIQEVFSKYVYVFDPKEVRTMALLPQSVLVRQLLEDEKIFASTLAKSTDYFDYCLAISNKRDYYFAKLFCNDNLSVSLYNRAHKFILAAARSKSLEVL